jgi:Flp pilus assembly protein TadB
VTPENSDSKNSDSKNSDPKNSDSKNSTSKNSRYEKTYLILVSIFLAAILFYTLYIGQFLWGMVIDILILRLYFLMKRERRYFRELDQNEDEAGIPHDPKMKRRIRFANMLLIIFVLGLVVNSYFTSQFIWGIVAGLLILLYIHMLLFSGDNL